MPYEGLGLGTPLQNAGTPAAGTDEVQTITTTGTPAGGTFRLSYGGMSSGAIAFNATAAAIDTALEAIPAIGTNNLTCAGGPLPTGVTVTFTAALGRQPVALLVVSDNSLTGGSSPAPAVARTTPGVAATGRGAPRGARLIDLNTGVQYTNTSANAAAPTWVTIGSQT